MNGKIVLITALSIVFFSSCRKDEKLETPEPEPVLLPEEINPAFSNTRMQMHKSESDYYKGGGYGTLWETNWQIDYRLEPGVKKDDKVFYPISKKWDVYNFSGYMEDWQIVEVYNEENMTEDWHAHHYFYRYDVNKRISYRYDGMDDDNPRMLLDFNYDPWEKILINSEYGIYFEIHECKTVVSNGVEYPYYVGRFDFNYGNTKWVHYDNKETVLSPFNPNPFYMMEDFLKVEKMAWEAFRVSQNESEPENWPQPYQYYPQMQITQEIDSTLNLLNLSSSYYGY